MHRATTQAVAAVAAQPRDCLPRLRESNTAVAGFGSVWVASSGEESLWVQNRTDGSVSRIDPATNRDAMQITPQ
jgi:hypothetical protein